MTKDELITFERDIFNRYEKAKIKGPIHLSSGNEDQLLEIFQNIKREDWVFSTWRSHYHALLHGVPEDEVRKQILAGKSISLCWPEFRFYSSAIVGATCSQALGVALGLKRQNKPEKVWCFVGDMTAETGAFHEAHKYASNFDLPIVYVEENNEISTTTPTKEAWNKCKYPYEPRIFCVDKYWLKYDYKLGYPHQGIGKWVAF